MDRILNYRPTYLEDINDRGCGNMYVYDRNNGKKSAFLHYVDGMEVWEFCPELWRGWKRMLIIDSNEKSVF